MKKTIEYEIVDVDYFENDAYLVVDGKKYFFQWGAKSEPTIVDALEFFKKDSKFYKGLSGSQMRKNLRLASDLY